MLNNSLTPHKSNNNTALTPKELASELLKFKSCITALVFCERIGAPLPFDDLRDQDFTVFQKQSLKKTPLENFISYPVS